MFGILLFFGGVLFAQTIPIHFIPNQVAVITLQTTGKVADMFSLSNGGDIAVNLPRSFFLGNDNSNNPGLCYWLINEYNFNVGDMARVTYYVWENGTRYTYKIDVNRWGIDEWKWWVWRTN